MVTRRVPNENEIMLDDEFYPIIGPVQRNLSSIFPAKITIGDNPNDTQQVISTATLNDWRGGVGQDRIDSSVDSDRAWTSDWQLRYDKHLVHPRLTTTTAASGISGAFTIGAMGELADEIYVAFGTAVRKYSLAGDTWGSTVHTLPAVATDAITLRLNGTVYLIFAHTGGYSYTTDGSSWTDDTKDVKYFFEWDDRLWGIDETGQLWYSLTIGAETDDAQLSLPNVFVTDLYKDRDAAGNTILYAATKQGLFAHDAANAKFFVTELDLPFHDDAGFGVSRWRGSANYPAGNSVYRYSVGPTATITTIGPDRDDGLTDERRGTIIQTLATHNDLMILLDSTSAAATNRAQHITTGMTSHHGLHAAIAADPDIGISSILGWNDLGWEYKWVSDDNTLSLDYGLISSAYNGYRMWWAHNERVLFQDLPVDIVNPDQASDMVFATSATHKTPWVVVGQEVSGVALRLRVECQGMSATETITPAYALDFDDSDYTALTAITSNGITTYTLPSTASPVGVAFRSIRFRIVGASSGAGNSPDMVGLKLEFYKELDSQHSYNVVIDLSNEYADNSVEEMRTNLATAIDSKLLVTFAQHDEATSAATAQLRHVNVTSERGFEYTGPNHRGQMALTLTEL